MGCKYCSHQDRSAPCTCSQTNMCRDRSCAFHDPKHLETRGRKKKYYAKMQPGHDPKPLNVLDGKGNSRPMPLKEAFIVVKNIEGATGEVVDRHGIVQDNSQVRKSPWIGTGDAPGRSGGRLK